MDGSVISRADLQSRSASLRHLRHDWVVSHHRLRKILGKKTDAAFKMSGALWASESCVKKPARVQALRTESLRRRAIVAYVSSAVRMAGSAPANPAAGRSGAL